METLTIIMASASAIAALLQIVLIVKFWKMCNRINDIHAFATKEARSFDQLLKWSIVDKPLFEEALFNMIYRELIALDSSPHFDSALDTEYERLYNMWKDRCAKHGWHMPERLAKCTTWEKFQEEFIFTDEHNRIILSI